MMTFLTPDSVEHGSRDGVTCLSIAAGLHALVLLWNPVLLQMAFHTMIRPTPLITIERLPDPLPVISTAPRRVHPVATPIAIIRTVPIQKPSFHLTLWTPHPPAPLDTLAPLTQAPIVLDTHHAPIHGEPAPLPTPPMRSNVWRSAVFPSLHQHATEPLSAPLARPTVTSHDLITVPMRAHSAPGPAIEGPLAGLHIIHRQLPEYPGWAEEQGAVGVVRLRFTVTPAGTVRSIIDVLRTSGYDVLDGLAIEALRHWRFEPRPESGADAQEWGIITFTFSLTNH